MAELRIDLELQSLVPPLSDDEYRTLEASILEEGIRDAIIATMDGVIVDGHNRYEIAKKNGFDDGVIPVERRYFEDRAEVMVWIIDNQRGRRNLSKQAWLDLGFKRAELLKPKADANRGGWKGNQYTKPDEAESQKSDKQPNETVDTLQEAADYAGVSRDTAAKYKKITESDNEELKEKVRSGETSINRAYGELKQREEPKPVGNDNDGELDALLPDRTMEKSREVPEEESDHKLSQQQRIVLKTTELARRQLNSITELSDRAAAAKQVATELEEWSNQLLH